MILPSHCFYIFHTKQSIVQITFNHFKHPQMKSRNFPTFKMRAEEYLLQWCLLSTMVWERYVPPSLTACLLFFLLFTPFLPPINPSSHFHLPSFISSFFLPFFLPSFLPSFPPSLSRQSTVSFRYSVVSVTTCFEVTVSSATFQFLYCS